ncbi:S-layer homology domain-containing protein [Sporosarcina sp. A2]|uniref:S-layer homology domain-containing protein n=1 Tax=Sporosarcina sp. A2 TaxID=3393449 RepID=UPI003D794ADC
MANALKLPKDDIAMRKFADVPARAEQAIAALKQAGIVQGKSDQFFGFADSIKRGEMALMLRHA